MPLADIKDNDVYTGRELKQLLRTLLEQKKSNVVRWISLEYAAAILQCKRDTLRKRAARWLVMTDPPVRVRKLSDADASHWLLDEDDVHALRRAETPVPEVAIDDDAALRAHWAEMATRNL